MVGSNVEEEIRMRFLGLLALQGSNLNTRQTAIKAVCSRGTHTQHCTAEQTSRTRFDASAKMSHAQTSGSKHSLPLNEQTSQQQMQQN